MRRIAAILIACGIALAAFGWWGLNSPAGMRAFDEMDGIIPFAALVLSVPMLLAALILRWVARRA